MPEKVIDLKDRNQGISLGRQVVKAGTIQVDSIIVSCQQAGIRRQKKSVAEAQSNRGQPN